MKTRVTNGKAVGILIRCGDNQDVTEIKHEANNLHKLFHNMYFNKKVSVKCTELFKYPVCRLCV